MRRGLAGSRTQAQQLIGEGRVTVDGAPATKPSTLVSGNQALVVAGEPERWASRGGHKLDQALAELRVEPAGRHCLDAGASTGGFTDVLLQRGALRVVAVDVGYGQVAWRLRQDSRVVLLERTNVRHLDAASLPPPPPDLVVADLSFISLTLVLPTLVAVARSGAEHLLLVKPQFEAGPERVGRGGVVRDPGVWRDALHAVVGGAAALGLGLAGAAPSRLPGPAGNVEFFVHLRGDAAGDQDRLVAEAVEAGEALAAASPSP